MVAWGGHGDTAKAGGVASRRRARGRYRPRLPRVREKGPSVTNVVLLVIIGLLVVLAAPVWPWSRGWTWAPAGMLLMGLATMLLFTWTVVPE
jgi:hypothetical protein